MKRPHLRSTSSRFPDSVATLAESAKSTTCSAIIARRLHLGIVPAESFEQAVDLVKVGLAPAALVPGAYPGIGAFLMDPVLWLLRSRAAMIPALVLAAKKNASGVFRVAFAHPATKPLWAGMGIPITAAASNDAAAAAVTRHDIACITNEVAARRFGLQVLQVVRASSPMAWNIFVRKDVIE
ncbi:MAG TPA: hypothetical protein PJ982_09685 [Lacipirellulaceae bacterium]|nr:hypothetical protein [Lacipirellulaceae bacterium]